MSKTARLLIYLIIGVPLAVGGIAFFSSTYDNAPTCGSREMQPGDTCDHVQRRGGGSAELTYDDQRAADRRLHGIIGFGAAGLGLLIVAAGLWVVLSERKHEKTHGAYPKTRQGMAERLGWSYADADPAVDAAYPPEGREKHSNRRVEKVVRGEGFVAFDYHFTAEGKETSRTVFLVECPGPVADLRYKLSLRGYEVEPKELTPVLTNRAFDDLRRSTNIASFIVRGNTLGYDHALIKDRSLPWFEEMLAGGRRLAEILTGVRAG